MTTSRAENSGSLYSWSQNYRQKINLWNKICMMKWYRKSTAYRVTKCLLDVGCFESSFNKLTQSSVIYSNAQLKLPNKKDQSFKKQLITARVPFTLTSQYCRGHLELLIWGQSQEVLFSQNQGNISVVKITFFSTNSWMMSQGVIHHII